MSDIEIRWPDTITTDFIKDLVRIATDIAATGEPTGWGKNPHKDDLKMWAARMMAKVKLGDAAIAAGFLDGTMQGVAVLQKSQKALTEHSAEFVRIITHPQARGQGLAQTMTEALIDRAKAFGVETITVALRGNNQGGIAFYEARGFEIAGRLPNIIEIGDDRYDEVTMYIQFPPAEGVTRHGSDPDTQWGTHRAGMVHYPEEDSVRS